MASYNQIFKSYFQRKIILFLFLGLSCAIPIGLLGGALSTWAFETGIDLKTIGCFSLILIPFSLKFLWAPIIDFVRLPILYRIGQKKSWGIVFLSALLFCLGNVSVLDIQNQLTELFFWCILSSFFSASWDIVVDSLRIDILSGDDLKEGSSIYQLGYRLGTFLSVAGMLYLSARIPWDLCYQIALIFILSGLVALIFVKEQNRVVKKKDFLKSVVLPFSDFVQRHQKWALIIIFIVLYKMCNAFLGKMAYPFYYDNGFTKEEVATISGLIGPFITMTGVFLGGILMVKSGYYKSMLYLGYVEILTSLAYAGMSLTNANIVLFFLVILFDNIVGGMGGAVFVGFLSSLCSKKYSASQYALLTSFMMVSTSVLASYSGKLAQDLGWGCFFVMTGFLMIPALFVLQQFIGKDNV